LKITNIENDFPLGMHFAIAALEIHGSVTVVDENEMGSEMMIRDEFDPWAVNDFD
jgi:hypothetical protein